MSSKKKRTSKKIATKEEGFGPNKVRHEHFKLAVELARKCKAEEPGRIHPKVGAVVVKEGEVIVSAYRGEVGRGDHAEFIALERKGGDDSRIEGADLLTTLEPCTVRAHDKKPCVSWIKSRRLRKVWIGTLDYNPAIAGVGELELQRNSILIGRFPDEFSKMIITDNAEFFKIIEAKQPRITLEEQKKERTVIINAINGFLRQQIDTRNMLLTSFLHPLLLKKGFKKFDDVFNELRKIINQLTKSLEHTLAVQFDSVGSWSQLGRILFENSLFGASNLAYRIATEIDATHNWSWNGLVKSEIELHRDSEHWPYSYTPQPLDTSPSSIHSRTWIRETEFEGNFIMSAKMLLRSFQLGNRTEELQNFIVQLAKEKHPTDEGFRIKYTTVWVHLAQTSRAVGAIEISEIAWKKADDIIIPNKEEFVRRIKEIYEQRKEES